MPVSSRPRERLLDSGVEALSDIELLAILLRTGNKDQSVISLAKDVLFHLESLKSLTDISIEELCQIKGIKTAKAAVLIAAIELGKRLYMKTDKQRIKISNTTDVYYLMRHISVLTQEHFYAIYLNTQNEVIKTELIYKGTVNNVYIHPREIFSNAVKLLARSIIFVHNHPSGNSRPSSADIEATRRLMKAANVIDIEVLDHVIIGDNEYFSIVENKIYRRWYILCYNNIRYKK